MHCDWRWYGAPNEFVHDCRTEAKLSTKLKDMKVTIYKDDGDNKDDGNRLEGPRVFVYLSKPSASLPLFSGLGLTEGLDTNLPPPRTEVTGFTPSMEAYAFARVYFTQHCPATEATRSSTRRRSSTPSGRGGSSDLRTRTAASSCFTRGDAMTLNAAKATLCRIAASRSSKRSSCFPCC